MRLLSILHEAFIKIFVSLKFCTMLVLCDSALSEIKMKSLRRYISLIERIEFLRVGAVTMTFYWVSCYSHRGKNVGNHLSMGEWQIFLSSLRIYYHCQNVSARHNIFVGSKTLNSSVLADGRPEVRNFFILKSQLGKKCTEKGWRRFDKRCTCLLRHPFVSCGLSTLLNEFSFRENIWWTDHVVDMNVRQFHVLERANQTGYYSDSLPTTRICLFYLVYKWDNRSFSTRERCLSLPNFVCQPAFTL